MHFHEFCDGKTRLRFEGQRVHTARFFLQVQFYAVAFSMLTFAQTSLNVVLPTLPLSTSFHTYSGSSFAGATLRDHFLYCEAVLLCSCVFGANFCADVFKCCSDEPLVPFPHILGSTSLFHPAFKWRRKTCVC
jgi:multidrug transporter EmrE-like cation transporter